MFTTSLPPPQLSSSAFSSSFCHFLKKKSANLNINHISESLMSNYDSADQNFVDENSAGQLFLLKIQLW